MNNLPVWATVGRAYGTAFGERAMLLKIATVWLVLVLAASVAASFVMVETEVPRAVGAGIILAILAIAVAATAVSWQRAILLGEPPAGWLSLSLDGRVWRCFALGAGLMIVLYAALLFVRQLLAADFPGDQMVGLAGSVAAMLVATLLFIRLSLKFPAIAVDDAAMTLARAWRLSRGNTLRLWLGIVVCLAPMIIGLHGLSFVFASPLAEDAPVLRLALALMMIALAFLEAGILGAFLAFAYRALVPEDQPAAPLSPA